LVEVGCVWVEVRCVWVEARCVWVSSIAKRLVSPPRVVGIIWPYSAQLNFQLQLPAPSQFVRYNFKLNFRNPCLMPCLCLLLLKGFSFTCLLFYLLLLSLLVFDSLLFDLRLCSHFLVLLDFRRKIFPGTSIQSLFPLNLLFLLLSLNLLNLLS